MRFLPENIDFATYLIVLAQICYSPLDHDKWTHYASTFFLYEKPGKWIKYWVFGTFCLLAKYIKISKRQATFPLFSELN